MSANSINIKEHCCGADSLFDTKTAEKEYKKYLKNGPSRVTRKLISQLSEIEKGNTLLDVGGGIGAIQWWFLESGGKATIGVDASSAYLKVAEEHAVKNGLEEKSRFLMGDFANGEIELSEADHISMDKVICCYPDYSAILNLACEKSKKTISLSYPMDGFIAQIFRSLGVLYMKYKGIAFRPYVHDVKSVRALLIENGFKRKYSAIAFPWHVETYVRK